MLHVDKTYPVIMAAPKMSLTHHSLIVLSKWNWLLNQILFLYVKAFILIPWKVCCLGMFSPQLDNCPVEENNNSVLGLIKEQK